MIVSCEGRMELEIAADCMADEHETTDDRKWTMREGVRVDDKEGFEEDTLH